MELCDLETKKLKVSLLLIVESGKYPLRESHSSSCLVEKKFLRVGTAWNLEEEKNSGMSVVRGV